VATIDWQKSGQDIYNLVRGCDPQPGAYSFWQGEKIRFYGARLLGEPTTETPGPVVQADTEGLQVAVEGGKLSVGKVRSESGGKVEASAFVSESGLKAGDQFGEAG
jgi:methionyl-tRNA formyltransferase